MSQALFLQELTFMMKLDKLWNLINKGLSEEVTETDDVITVGNI